MPILLRCLLPLSLLLGFAPAWAWGGHALMSYRVFEAMPEVARAEPVTAEPLEAFLRAQEPALVTLLADQEAWARARLKDYPPRPEALIFRADPARSDAQRRADFLGALRLSPDSRLSLFRQIDPRHESDPGEALPADGVSSVPASKGAAQRFVALQPGERVAPLAVLASATDEPDYGMDIGLFADNGTPAAARYGLGPQPFGNPAVSISSQAPFHMSFAHQGAVFNTVAPAFARTFGSLRVHQFSTLAQLAWRSGHPYWAWRFAGWALHYVQDLTQPYHASAAPGSSTAGMLWAELLSKLGLPDRKRGLVVLQSNRHFVLERYQTQLVLAAALARQDTANERALRDASRDASYPPWSDAYLINVVAREAFGQGPATDAAVVTGAPMRYVLDPALDFGASAAGVDLDAEMRQQLQAQRQAFQDCIARLLGHFGSHSRNALRGILLTPQPPG